MKRSAHVAGIANIENGIISLQLENLSIRPSSAASSPPYASPPSASPPSASCSPPPVVDVLAKIQDGTYTTHESKRDLTGRKIFSHLCYLQHRHSLQVGLKGEWSPTAEAALRLWLRSPKKGFRQQADERTLAITDAPATSTLAIVDTPDTKNLAIEETPDPKTSATVDNNNDNTNDDGTAPSSSSGSSSSSSSSGSDSSMPKTKSGLRARVKKLEARNSQLKAALEETSQDLFWANHALGCNRP